MTASLVGEARWLQLCGEAELPSATRESLRGLRPVVSAVVAVVAAVVRLRQKWCGGVAAVRKMVLVRRSR